MSIITAPPEQAAAPPAPAKQTPMQRITEGVEKRLPQLSQMIPAGIDVQRLKYVAFEAVKKNPDLLKCDPSTVITAITQAFEIGLEPNTPKKQAYLIPYGTECQFMPSYIGLIALATRSGMVRSIKAREVRANDIFTVRQGTEESITHIPASTDRGDIVAAYSVAVLADGSIDFEVMYADDLAEVRKASQAKKSPWDNWEGEMSKKAVMRRHCKRLPMDDAMARAVEIDNGGDIIDMQPVAASTTRSRVEELKAQLAGGNA
jgi:recombination protein RecT